MKFGSWLAVYFVIWWIVLFTVLPFGFRRGEAAEPVAGADPGAPARPRFGLIIMLTSLVSLGVFAVVWWALETWPLV